MRKYLLALIVVITVTTNTLLKQQSCICRYWLALSEQLPTWRWVTSMKPSIIMPGNTLPMVVSSGKNANPVVIYVRFILEKLPHMGIGCSLQTCVSRTKNSHGNLRIGASLGSDTESFLGVSIWAMNKTIHWKADGNSTGKWKVIA